MTEVVEQPQQQPDFPAFCSFSYCGSIHLPSQIDMCYRSVRCLKKALCNQHGVESHSTVRGVAHCICFLMLFLENQHCYLCLVCTSMLQILPDEHYCCREGNQRHFFTWAANIFSFSLAAATSEFFFCIWKTQTLKFLEFLNCGGH